MTGIFSVYTEVEREKVEKKLWVKFFLLNVLIYIQKAYYCQIFRKKKILIFSLVPCEFKTLYGK